MSVINAIRNKLIHRIFAVIKRATPYKKNYEPIINNNLSELVMNSKSYSDFFLCHQSTKKKSEIIFLS